MYARWATPLRGVIGPVQATWPHRATKSEGPQNMKAYHTWRGLSVYSYHESPPNHRSIICAHVFSELQTHRTWERSPNWFWALQASAADARSDSISLLSLPNHVSPTIPAPVRLGAREAMPGQRRWRVAPRRAESTHRSSPTVFDAQHHAEGRWGGAGVPYHDEATLRPTRSERIRLVSSCRTTTREVMFGKRSRRTTPRRDKATRGGAGSLLFHTRSRGVSASGQVRMKERLRPSARWFLQHHSTGWNRSNLFHASLRMTCSSPFHYPRCWFCSAYFPLGFPA